MTITEIKQFPIRVKLNSNFQLNESFDVGTILQLNNVSVEFEGSVDISYKVSVTALGSDLEYNKSISVKDWRDFKTNEYNLDIFEFHKDDIKPNGDFNTSIFVMGDDDCFDLVDELKIPRYSIEDILLIVKEIAPGLKPHITESNVQQFIDGLKRKQ
jgi:hypothetical protein